MPNFKIKPLRAVILASLIGLSVDAGANMFNVKDGEVFTNIHITGNVFQSIQSGGFVGETLIDSGGQQRIYSGGVSDTTIINDNGYQLIYGGVAKNSSVNKGGQQRIYDGGMAESTIINDGGVQHVLVGVSNDTVINNNGIQRIYDGSTADTTLINLDGSQVISSGGIAKRTTINAGGIQSVLGVADDTVVNGGVQSILSGGVSNNAVVNDSGMQKIYAGGEADTTSINDGGFQSINSGAVANDTVVNNGGVQSVLGTANGTIINGGTQSVYGITSDTVINSGQSVLASGALASGVTEVNSNGELVMETLSKATDVNINGGTLSITDVTDLTSGNTPAQVDNLQMNGGSVSFMRDSEGEFASLHISQLSGTGNFLFNTSLAERNSNFVTIEQGNGNFGLSVTDSGKEISDHTDLTLNLVNDKGGDIHFAMLNGNGRSTGVVDGGTYMYTLYNEKNKDGLNGNVWYLGVVTEDENGGEEPGTGGENPGTGGENPGTGGENPGTGGENPGTGGENPGTGGENPGTGGGQKPKTTPATDAILSMGNAGLRVVNAELDAFRAYRSNLENTAHDNNVWAHYLGSKNRVNTSNGADYRLEQNGLEIGADTRNEFSRGTLVTGAFMSFSDNQVKHARGGKSNIKSYGLGMYATWFDNMGYYAEGVIKVNRLNSELSAEMTNGGTTNGDWNQYAISSSLEGGYKLQLNDFAALTPYARLTVAQVSGKDISLSNGMTGKIETPRSIAGEAGAKVSGKFSWGKTEISPYVSAAVVQEFSKSNDVTINDINRFNNNVDGTSGKYGVGTSINVGKEATIYGEVNYRQGSHIESPVQGVLGVRVGF